MPTFLGQSFLPAWRGSPAGMSPRDKEIWYRWIDKHEDDVIRVYYNVRVGGGSFTENQDSPDDLLAWLMLTMLRIDVVAETKDHVLLIELRPTAGRSLFGALMIYKQLWASDPKIIKPSLALGVCDSTTEQIRSMFELNGLRLETV